MFIVNDLDVKMNETGKEFWLMTRSRDTFDLNQLIHQIQLKTGIFSITTFFTNDHVR